MRCEGTRAGSEKEVEVIVGEECGDQLYDKVGKWGGGVLEVEVFDTRRRLS